MVSSREAAPVEPRGAGLADADYAFGYTRTGIVV